MIRSLILILLFWAGVAGAQDRRPSHCFAVADAAPELHYIYKASWRDPVADEFSVRLSYIDHSMYLIQTHGGLNAVTDFVGFIGEVGLVPDVVTMNNAHDSHWTAFPHPEIPNVLPGWRMQGQPADHHVDLGEMLVRNVTTDIRDRFGGGSRIEGGNSIFIFEVGGLCIGHLGHLHHEPSDETYAAIGRLDVVMAAVDGGLTVDTPTMVRIIKRLRSSIVLPMHWFSRGSLEGFLAGVGDEFRVQRPGGSEIEVSLRNLPSEPTVIVLQPRFLRQHD